MHSVKFFSASLQTRPRFSISCKCVSKCQSAAILCEYSFKQVLPHLAESFVALIKIAIFVFMGHLTLRSMKSFLSWN